MSIFIFFHFLKPRISFLVLYLFKFSPQSYLYTFWFKLFQNYNFFELIIIILFPPFLVNLCRLIYSIINPLIRYFFVVLADRDYGDGHPGFAGASRLHANSGMALRDHCIFNMVTLTDTLSSFNLGFFTNTKSHLIELFVDPLTSDG